MHTNWKDKASKRSPTLLGEEKKGVCDDTTAVHPIRIDTGNLMWVLDFYKSKVVTSVVYSTDQIAVGLLPNAIFIEFTNGLFKLVKVEQTSIFPGFVPDHERILIGSDTHLWHLRATTEVPSSKIYFKFRRDSVSGAETRASA